LLFSSSGVGRSIGSIIGTVVAILIIFALCCVCCICCAFKGAKDKLSNAFKSSDHGQQAATGAVAFTAMQESQNEQTGYHPNPGYQAQPTPVHNGLPYSVHPDGPAPIPPTQPGYTNTYPSLDDAPTYPTNPGNGAMPYPPQPSGAPYPPLGATSSPYPPIAGDINNSAPYPPAYPGPQGQYPQSTGPYPPLSQQPAYNPTAPP